MNGYPRLYSLLKELGISFDYYEHPPVATIGEARKYWKDIEASHCKNLFFEFTKGIVITWSSWNIPMTFRSMI